AAATGADLYLCAEGGPEWRYRFDHLPLHDGDVIEVGDVTLTALHTPGHMPEHLAFLVAEGEHGQPAMLLSGDFFFAGDVGRPDLLDEAAGYKVTKYEGARQLMQILQRLHAEVK